MAACSSRQMQLRCCSRDFSKPLRTSTPEQQVGGSISLQPNCMPYINTPDAGTAQRDQWAAAPVLVSMISTDSCVALFSVCRLAQIRQAWRPANAVVCACLGTDPDCKLDTTEDMLMLQMMRMMRTAPKLSHICKSQRKTALQGCSPISRCFFFPLEPPLCLSPVDLPLFHKFISVCFCPVSQWACCCGSPSCPCRGVEKGSAAASGVKAVLPW